jgi:hypothetical protein
LAACLVCPKSHTKSSPPARVDPADGCPLPPRRQLAGAGPAPALCPRCLPRRRRSPVTCRCWLALSAAAALAAVANRTFKSRSNLRRTVSNALVRPVSAAEHPQQPGPTQRWDQHNVQAGRTD